MTTYILYAPYENDPLCVRKKKRKRKINDPYAAAVAD